MSTTTNARTPRQLEPSPGLLRVLDKCNGATVTGLDGGRRSSPEVSLATLERIEGELGVSLDDDVLVVVAVADPLMRLLSGIEDVNSVADAADEHPAPEGYACIAVVYSDPVGELVAEAHGAAYLHLAAPTNPTDEQGHLLVCNDGYWDAARETTLAELVDEQLHAACSGEWQEHIALGGEGEPRELDPPASLVPGHALELPDAPVGDRVTHPKFGEGEVIDRTGDGDQEKVRVRFADSERTLLARFVSPVE